MKLCVFQGTFNPIHNAHIRVGKFVRQKYCFDKIIFIPAYIPPHKKCDVSLTKHRYKMTELALKSYPFFEISDIEYKRKGKSYTYLTLLELTKQYDFEDKINFIIGTDAFEKIESWYEADKLKNLVKFIVFIREENFNQAKYNYLKDKGYDFEFQPLTFEDISSTELRQKIKNSESISEFVPKQVEEYIKENELYKN